MRTQKSKAQAKTIVDLEQRFYDFAVAIVKFVNKFDNRMTARELGRQLLRSGTSIAANYAEAKGAFSKSDFIYKLNISFKEARETCLWLSLLSDAGVIEIDVIFEALLIEAKEIRNILGKSVRTAKESRK